MNRLGRWTAIPVVAAAVMAAGCTNRLTRENYERIGDGMSVGQVESILGKGDEKVGIGGAVGNLVGSVRVIHWERGNRTITLTFLNDKMTSKVATGL